MRSLGVFVVLFLLLASSSLALEINEVMYNPSGKDNNQEFIEIFSEDFVNLSNFIIADSSAENILKELQVANSHYTLIVEEGFNYSQINASIYSAGATIGNNLGNSEDNLTLFYPNGTIADNFHYFNSLGANGDGNSLQLIANEWFASIPTPGKENELSLDQDFLVAEESENIILSPYLDEIIYTNNEYTKLFKIEIKQKSSCSEKDTVTVAYSITNIKDNVKEAEFTKEVGCSSYASTGEFTPTESGEYTLCGKIVSSTVGESNLRDNSVCFNFTVVDTSIIPCDLVVNISTSGDLFYEKGETVKFKTQLNNNTFPFLIDYWIEDFFGNKVKNKITSANTNQKSWKTKIDEEDRVLFIKAELIPFCNDTNLSNNFAEKMFIVTNQETEISAETAAAEEDSVLEIVKVPEEVKFGEVVKAEVEIYKGNTNKYSLSVWVEKEGKIISEKTTFHLKDKHSQYQLTLPIQLKPNCDRKIKEGEAQIIVEGLDLRTKKEISLVGINEKLCREVIIKIKEKVVEKEVPVETSLPGVMFDNPFSEKRDLSQSPGAVVYESNSTKAKNIIPYLIAVTFGLLCLVLLKRG